MAPKPKKLGWAEAASVPVSALTAWQAFFEHAGVKGLEDPVVRGKRVLVIAAAGSVGVWLVQLAKMAGLEVVAQVGSAESERLVRGSGAVEVVNYKMTELREWAEKNEAVDIVSDCLGGKTLGDAWYCVKNGGALISIVEPPEEWRPDELKNKSVESEFFILSSNSQQLAELSRMADEGQCLTLEIVSGTLRTMRAHLPSWLKVTPVVNWSYRSRSDVISVHSSFLDSDQVKIVFVSSLVCLRQDPSS